ncbi:hypothetical protein FHX44_112976 [Pseudonocardia hierapolitana]|uniref:Sporulation and spore germination protein n=1 Tax=Pseudonocardia hierapolitana TaxID=1128676 RepID=A0A561SQD4_9PSEU|nr:hypothetical protein [Pseudonocardia hierapolitana]TWF77074.1 hypothetical protein FHX44_112976 [Pseudonocardia hierapolitana]
MTITIVRRNRAVLAGCVAGIALLTACGGGGGPAGSGPLAAKPAAEVAREAPDVTRAAGSSRYAVEMTYSTTGSPMGDSSWTASGTGTYDYARQIGEGRMTTKDAQFPVPPQETVFRNNVLYQRDVGATRWQKFDFSQLVNTPIGQHDPSQQLDLLRGVSDDVREVATTQVRGAQVRQYAITIDPPRLAGASGVVVDGGLVQAALQAAGPMPGQVFVDSDGRVRRLEVSIESNGADLAASPEMSQMFGDNPQLQEMLRNRRTTSSVSIEYFDFGVPVTAQEPDPSQADTGPAVPGLPGGN